MIEKPDPKARFRLNWGVAVVGLMHVLMALLTVTNRSVPVLPVDAHSALGDVAEMADSNWWAVGHMSVVGLLVTLLIRDDPVHISHVCCLSGFIMLWWGLLVAAWSQSTHPNSSLTGPVLAIVCALGTFVLAAGWSTADRRHE